MFVQKSHKFCCVLTFQALAPFLIAIEVEEHKAWKIVITLEQFIGNTPAQIDENLVVTFLASSAESVGAFRLRKLSRGCAIRPVSPLFAVRNPYDFLVTSFTLLFRPSTAPDEIAPRARNQFKISG